MRLPSSGFLVFAAHSLCRSIASGVSGGSVFVVVCATVWCHTEGPGMAGPRRVVGLGFFCYRGVDALKRGRYSVTCAPGSNPRSIEFLGSFSISAPLLVGQFVGWFCVVHVFSQNLGFRCAARLVRTFLLCAPLLRACAVRSRVSQLQCAEDGFRVLFWLSISPCYDAFPGRSSLLRMSQRT